MVSVSYGQVGINTETPNTTFDVVRSSDETKPDGIQAPRVTYSQLVEKNNAYGTNQTGAIVYVTVAPASTVTPTGKVVNVKTVGYYFFDGSVWQILSKEPWNVTKSSTADVDIQATSNIQDIYQMGKVGIGISTGMSAALHVLKNNPDDSQANAIFALNHNSKHPRISINRARHNGTNRTHVAKDDILGSVEFQGLAENSGAGFIPYASIRSRVDFDVTADNVPGNIEIWTGGRSGGSSAQRVVVTSAGNVGINTSTPTEILHVNGNTFVNGNTVVEKVLHVNGMVSSPETKYIAEFNLGANGYAYANSSDDRGILFKTNSTASGGFLSSITTGTTSTGNGNNADRYLKLNIRTNSGEDDVDFIIRSTSATDRRVGINVKVPTAKLHIRRGDTPHLLRLEGLLSGAGSVLVIDSDGYVKKSGMTSSFTSNSNNSELLSKIDNLEEKIRILEEKISQLISE